MRTDRRTPSPSPLPVRLQTPLAKLCRYYADCLTRESELTVSMPASRAGRDFVELPSMPLADEEANIFGAEAAPRFLARIRRERSPMVIQLGYPVRVRRAYGREGEESYSIEPVCLWPLHDDPNDPAGPPLLADDTPSFNFAVLNRLCGGGSVLDEAIQLAEDLGIHADAAEPPALTAFFERLHEQRTEWDWRERPLVQALSTAPPLGEIGEEGIYNRAVLLASERSPYTQGLEAELRELAKLQEHEYAGTALGQWISGNFEPVPPRTEDPWIEVLPLNSEQRTALSRSFNAPLTVITGPPGTGKSQVVTSLLVNAAWRGKKVLFASKNNKAVDVVEQRCNSLGPRPVLLRTGGGDNQLRLAEYLDSLLAARATPEDEARFNEALAIHSRLRRQLQDLEELWKELTVRRNEADALEQETEGYRTLLQPANFQHLRRADLQGWHGHLQRIRTAGERAFPPRTGLLAGLAAPFLRGRRLRDLNEAISASRPLLSMLGMTAPGATGSAEDYRALLNSLQERFSAAERVADYFRALEELGGAPGPEQLAVRQRDLLAQMNANSGILWEAWLRLRPAALDQEQRRQLSQFVSLVRMQQTGGQPHTITAREVQREFGKVFPRVAETLNCWAVTSLSARHVPFRSGFFDLVVIDEASQCDIASALPLLYRAKAAVIIGDPKQLRHISATEKYDAQLLVKHGLLAERKHWAYSFNSLFDLARSVCTGDNIVNLRDHHRSHPDIIGFSNAEFYENRLRFATRYDALRHVRGPVVRWVDVQGRVSVPRSGSVVNEKEARAVVAELKRIVLEEGYEGTVGIVSPFRAQANRIRELIAKEGLEERLAPQGLIVDTVHRFQGDERDLMIFSPVASDGISNTSMLYLRRNGYLFNVAVTRAKAALVAVGNRQFAQQSGVDYLARFAAYSAGWRPPAPETGGAEDLGPVYPAVTEPERVSQWERVLYSALYAAGIHPVPQYVVEQYVLDFAVFDGDRRLNIEVDGEHYHRNWDGELCRRDQIRNERLIELGWDVMRFWVYQVRDDLPGCVERVRAWIAAAE